MADVVGAPRVQVHELTPEEGLEVLDQAARFYLGMAGEEFVAAWLDGKFDDDVDDADVMEVANDAASQPPPDQLAHSFRGGPEPTGGRRQLPFSAATDAGLCHEWRPRRLRRTGPLRATSEDDTNFPPGGGSVVHDSSPTEAARRPTRARGATTSCSSPADAAGNLVGTLVGPGRHSWLGGPRVCRGRRRAPLAATSPGVARGRVVAPALTAIDCPSFPARTCSLVCSCDEAIGRATGGA